MKILRYQSQLRNAFFVSFTIGTIMVFIMGGKDSGWIGPVLAMLVYIIFGTTTSKKIRVSTEFADSIYYLGFAFTLVSLLASTWIKLDTASPDKILKYFAIAIVTTIIGIIARLFISQFSKMPDEQIEDSNQRIFEMVNEYIENLNMISIQTSEKSNKILQSYDSLIELYSQKTKEMTFRFQKILDEHVSDVMDVIKNNTNIFQEQINTHTKNIIDDILSINLDTKEISSKYRKQVETIFNELNDNLNKIRSNLNNMADISSTINNVVRDSLDGMKENISEKVNAIKETFSEIANRFKQSSSDVSEEFKKNIIVINENIENTIKEMGNKTNKYNEQILDIFSKSIQCLQLNYSTYSSDLDSMSKDASSNIKKFVIRTESSSNKIIECLNNIVAGLETISFNPNSFKSTIDEIYNLNTTLKATMSILNDTYLEYNSRLLSLKNTNIEFRKQLDDLRTLLTQMNDILAEQLQNRL
jgi:molybdopterin converting factor small subunit